MSMRFSWCPLRGRSRALHDRGTFTHTDPAATWNRRPTGCRSLQETAVFGPRLQALVDRSGSQFEFHRDTESSSMYDSSVAKGGIN